MDIESLKIKLQKARKKQRDLRKEVDFLRQQLIKAGANPDAHFENLIPRNKEIYKQWKAGESFVDIANKFDLSSSRISFICWRIEYILEKKIKSFKEYKDLLKYKKKKK